MAPLVSVIIPVYNAEAFLVEALASVFAQDYEPFEVIVVDDGSTDRSGAVAQADRRVRYLRQENRGAAEARNAGASHASGELFAYVDADDSVPPYKLRLQAGYLVEHPEVSAVLGRQEWVDPPPGLARDVVWGDLDGIPLMSMVVRADVVRQVGPFHDASWGEDMDFLIRLREHGFRFVVLPDIVLTRRYHGGNLFAGRGLAPVPPISLKQKLDRERARAEKQP
jgi:alpha-1,6-rhamnosyltransferase